MANMLALSLIFLFLVGYSIQDFWVASRQFNGNSAEHQWEQDQLENGPF